MAAFIGDYHRERQFSDALRVHSREHSHEHFLGLEVPRVRLSISGVKSGTDPETPGDALRANSEFPGFVRLEIPEPRKTNQIPD